MGAESSESSQIELNIEYGTPQPNVNLPKLRNPRVTLANPSGEKLSTMPYNYQECMQKSVEVVGIETDVELAHLDTDNDSVRRKKTGLADDSDTESVTWPVVGNLLDRGSKAYQARVNANQDKYDEMFNRRVKPKEEKFKSEVDDEEFEALTEPKRARPQTPHHAARLADSQDASDENDSGDSVLSANIKVKSVFEELSKLESSECESGAKIEESEGVDCKQPVEVAQSEAKVFESKVDAKSVESKLVEVEPIDSKTDLKSLDVKPIDSKSVDVDKPIDVKVKPLKSVSPKGAPVKLASTVDSKAAAAKSTSAKSMAVKAKTAPAKAKVVESKSKSKTVDSQSKTVDSQFKTVDSQSKTVAAKVKPVDSKGKSVDVNGKPLHVKGKSNESKGESIDLKNKSVESKGKVVASKGKSVDVNGKPLQVKGKSAESVKPKGKPAAKPKVVESKTKPVADSVDSKVVEPKIVESKTEEPKAVNLKTVSNSVPSKPVSADAKPNSLDDSYTQSTALSESADVPLDDRQPPKSDSVSPSDTAPNSQPNSESLLAAHQPISNQTASKCKAAMFVNSTKSIKLVQTLDKVDESNAEAEAEFAVDAEADAESPDLNAAHCAQAKAADSVNLNATTRVDAQPASRPDLNDRLKTLKLNLELKEPSAAKSVEPEKAAPNKSAFRKNIRQMLEKNLNRLNAKETEDAAAIVAAERASLTCKVCDKTYKTARNLAKHSCKPKKGKLPLKTPQKRSTPSESEDDEPKPKQAKPQVALGVPVRMTSANADKQELYEEFKINEPGFKYMHKLNAMDANKHAIELHETYACKVNEIAYAQYNDETTMTAAEVKREHASIRQNLSKIISNVQLQLREKSLDKEISGKLKLRLKFLRAYKQMKLAEQSYTCPKLKMFSKKMERIFAGNRVDSKGSAANKITNADVQTAISSIGKMQVDDEDLTCIARSLENYITLITLSILATMVNKRSCRVTKSNVSSVLALQYAMNQDKESYSMPDHCVKTPSDGKLNVIICRNVLDLNSITSVDQVMDILMDEFNGELKNLWVKFLFYFKPSSDYFKVIKELYIKYIMASYMALCKLEEKRASGKPSTFRQCMAIVVNNCTWFPFKDYANHTDVNLDRHADELFERYDVKRTGGAVKRKASRPATSAKRAKPEQAAADRLDNIDPGKIKSREFVDDDSSSSDEE